jgi:serine/threonine protein kinase/formylglycine-generating enzyme required for sulfatase activity
MPLHTVPAERNLLFAILALQNSLVGKAGLLDGFHRWVGAKHRSLGEILVERGAMQASDRDLLEALVDVHLLRFGSPRKSLEALSPVPLVREELARIKDPEVQATLTFVAAGKADPDETVLRKDTGPSSASDVTEPLPRFRIVRPHAKGGLGQVSVAIDRDLDRTVALKEIQDRHADDPGSRARFVQEAEITGKLEHPGIVAVYGLGRDLQGRPFYAMRFIKGASLKEAIGAFHDDDSLSKDPAERSAERRKLLRRFTDVCNAVAYAHSRGVLHRDIKPGNVMLGPYGESLVVDWGLAKPLGRSLDPEGVPNEPVRPTAEETVGEGPINISSQEGSAVETVAGSPIGTVVFASPEQVAGRLDLLGPETDVYGLGATLYAILTGRPPVDGTDRADVIVRVERGDIRQPRSLDPTIPRPLEAICKKALALHPADRYPSVRALAHDIERWLDDLPVSVYREPLTTRIRRWIRKHRAPAAAIGAALTVTIVGLGIAGWVAARREQDARRQAQDRARHVLTADAGSVSSLVRSFGDGFTRVAPILAASWREPDLDPDARLRIALALGSTKPDAGPYLESRLLAGDPKTVRVVAERLGSLNAEAEQGRFWVLAEEPATPTAQRFRAACALAILDPPRASDGRSRWARHVDWVVREALLTASAFGEEIDRTLSPLEDLYLRAVGRCCREGDPERLVAFRLLKIHADRARDPRAFDTLARPSALIVDAEPEDFAWLLKNLETNRSEAVTALSAAVNDPDTLFGDEPSMKGQSGERRRALAVIALTRLGRADVLGPALKRSTEPGVRAFIIRELSRYGFDPAVLIEQLRAETDAGVRAAFVLALGGYERQKLSPASWQQARPILLDWYAKDPDPGIKSAVGWLLGTRWGEQAACAAIDREPSVQDPDPTGQRGWFVNKQGQRFSIIHGPQKFRMGLAAPSHPSAREDAEAKVAVPHEREVPRSFAIATTEVTVAQFNEFLEANKQTLPKGAAFYPRVSPDPNCPRHGVDWIHAIFYCRWLSEKEGVDPGQMCFPPLPEMIRSIETLDAHLNLIAGRLDATGYRLPTESEWELACRAGTTTPWSFGRTGSLLEEYAHFLGTTGANPMEAEARGHTVPVGLFKPNNLGLFDVYGNVREWCLDAFAPYPAPPAIVSDSRVQGPLEVDHWNRVIRGGSFADPASWVQSGYRNAELAEAKKVTVGFRVARTIP